MASDRTEKATPKRREDARMKGQIARRPEIAATASFLAALLMLRFSGADLLQRAVELFSKANSYVAAREQLTPSAVHGMLIDASSSLAVLSLPIIAAAMTAGIASNFAQGGLSF